MNNLASAARIIESSTGTHSLIFSVARAGSFRVSIRAVGLDSEEILEITESNLGKVSGGYVYIDSQKAERISLSVILLRPSLGSYRVICEEIIK